MQEKLCKICGKPLEEGHSVYCGSECAKKARNQATMRWKRKKQAENLAASPIKICIICGKAFQSNYHHKKCCSKECSTINNRRNTDKSNQRRINIVTKTCKICGTEFTTSNSTRKYCSDACRVQRHKISNNRYYYSKTKTPKIPKVKICANCGKEFQPSGKQKFCSKDCALTHAKNNHFNHLKPKIEKPKVEPTEFKLTPEQIAQRERLKAELLRRRSEGYTQKILNEVEALGNDRL